MLLRRSHFFSGVFVIERGTAVRMRGRGGAKDIDKIGGKE
jgi:hypothetical protein